MKQTYRLFIQRAHELTELKSILGLLQWDLETTLPKRGVNVRAGQISTLSVMYHKKLTCPNLQELLDQMADEDLDLWSKSSVKQLQRERDRAVCIPEGLVRELAKTTSLAYEAWVQARKESSFSLFSPWLDKVLDLKRKEATCFQSFSHPYEALLDEYEPEMTVSLLDSLFQSVKPRLSSLLDRTQASKHRPEHQILRGRFPISQQKTLGRLILTKMGFDWESGRLDTSPHPFCIGISPLDVRITTRYVKENFSSSLFAVIHEGGHALYEQGLDTQYYGLPACEAISLGIHESQSRLWENQVARSRPFWEYWLPKIKKNFPGSLEKLPLDNFLKAINHVKPSYIRVEADEVTYGLHVILRYELEKLMIEGNLQVKDLEEAWNSKMKEYLGIVPEHSSEGVLQDTHWSQGLIGYFPTYLLGNLYAAQIFSHVENDLPDLDQHLRNGHFKPLREWLRKKIHRHGKTKSPDELIKNISGRNLDPDYMLNYLEKKFGELYTLDKPAISC